MIYAPFFAAQPTNEIVSLKKGKVSERMLHTCNSAGSKVSMTSGLLLKNKLNVKSIQVIFETVVSQCSKVNSYLL